MRTALKFSAALAAAASLAACASANAPLPGYLFSLTAWTAGRDVEFLLVNVTDNTVRAGRKIVETVSIEVRDDTGAAVTDGFVRYDTNPPAPTARGAGRLRSQAAFRETLSAEALVRRVEAATGAPLDRARRYRLGFESATPVVAPDGAVLVAKVRSRSNCTLSFEGRRPAIACGSG